MRTVSSGALTTMTAEHLPCGIKNVISKDWLVRMIYAGSRTHVFISRRRFEPTTRGLEQKPDSIFKKNLLTGSEHYSPGVEGSSPVRGSFFLVNLFCSNTILALMPE